MNSGGEFKVWDEDRNHTASPFQSQVEKIQKKQDRTDFDPPK
jgi:hypothetical protein